MPDHSSEDYFAPHAEPASLFTSEVGHLQEPRVHLPKGKIMPSETFYVEHYTEGPPKLWCVVDRRNEHSVKWHESVGWNTTFSDRADAERLAAALNATDAPLTE